VAGVIGKKKFTYDLWSDAVNTASRMEALGEPGRIHCTREVYDLLAGEYEFEERPPVTVKGKGLLKTYFLLGRKASADGRTAGRSSE
jgi:class 3 adenylate cyclase